MNKTNNNVNFRYYNTYDEYLYDMTKSTNDICFIKDRNVIYTHGISFGDKTDLSGYYTKTEIGAIKDAIYVILDGISGRIDESKDLTDDEIAQIRAMIGTLNESVNSSIGSINTTVNDVRSSIDSVANTLQQRIDEISNNINKTRTDLDGFISGLDQEIQDDILNAITDSEGRTIWTRLSRTDEGVQMLSNKINTSLDQDGNIKNTEVLQTLVNAGIQNSTAFTNLANRWAVLNENQQVLEWLASGFRSQAQNGGSFAEMYAANNTSTGSAIAGIKAEVLREADSRYISSNIDLTTRIKDVVKEGIGTDSLAKIALKSEIDDSAIELTASYTRDIQDAIAAIDIETLLDGADIVSSASLITKISDYLSGTTSVLRTGAGGALKEGISSIITAIKNSNDPNDNTALAGLVNTIKQVEDGSYVASSAIDASLKDPQTGKITAASIIAAVNGGDSSIILDADHINIGQYWSIDNDVLSAKATNNGAQARLTSDSLGVYGGNTGVSLNSNGSISINSSNGNTLITPGEFMELGYDGQGRLRPQRTFTWNDLFYLLYSDRKEGQLIITDTETDYNTDVTTVRDAIQLDAENTMITLDNGESVVEISPDGVSYNNINKTWIELFSGTNSGSPSSSPTITFHNTNAQNNPVVSVTDIYVPIISSGGGNISFDYLTPADLSPWSVSNDVLQTAYTQSGDPRALLSNSSLVVTEGNTRASLSKEGTLSLVSENNNVASGITIDGSGVTPGVAFFGTGATWKDIIDVANAYSTGTLGGGPDSSSESIIDTWRPISVNGTAFKGSSNDSRGINFVAGSNVNLTANQDNITIDTVNTWRPIYVNGTPLMTSNINSAYVNFVAGDNISISASGNDIKINGQNPSNSIGIYNAKNNERASVPTIYAPCKNLSSGYAEFDYIPNNPSTINIGDSASYHVGLTGTGITYANGNSVPITKTWGWLLSLTDTWREIQVNGTTFKGTDADTDNGVINFEAGTNVELDTKGNKITINATAGPNSVSIPYNPDIYGKIKVYPTSGDSGEKVSIDGQTSDIVLGDPSTEAYVTINRSGIETTDTNYNTNSATWTQIINKANENLNYLQPNTDITVEDITCDSLTTAGTVNINGNGNSVSLNSSGQITTSVTDSNVVYNSTITGKQVSLTRGNNNPIVATWEDIIYVANGGGNTWRPIRVNGTPFMTSNLNSAYVNFKSDGNVSISAVGNDITISGSNYEFYNTKSSETPAPKVSFSKIQAPLNVNGDTASFDFFQQHTKDLHLSKTASEDSSISASGNINITTGTNKTVNIGSSTSVSGTLYTTSSITSGGTLYVTGTIGAGGNITTYGNIGASGDINADGDISANNNGNSAKLDSSGKVNINTVSGQNTKNVVITGESVTYNWGTSNSGGNVSITTDTADWDGIVYAGKNFGTNSSITSSMLATDSVTSVKIADGAVDTDQLADTAVTSNKINDGAVTSTKIANNAVTSAKLANNLSISGTFSASSIDTSGNISATGNISAIGALGVGGDIGLDGDLFAAGDISTQGNLRILVGNTLYKIDTAAAINAGILVPA